MTTAERIAVALETIAVSVEDPNAELSHRVVHLEMLARDFVRIMKDPQSTNEDWADLLKDTMDALGMEEGVTT